MSQHMCEMEWGEREEERVCVSERVCEREEESEGEKERERVCVCVCDFSHPHIVNMCLICRSAHSKLLKCVG
jgi:hypothetical protein